MKKERTAIKALCAALALALALPMLVACERTTNDSDAWDYVGQPFTNSKDMAAIVNGVTFHVRTDSADVLRVLGNEYDYSEVMSCVYDGYDKQFIYDGITVCTVPVDGVDVIEQFIITGGDYSTARNIKVGSTLDEIVAAYGEDYFDDGYVTYTESNDPANITEWRIQFYLVDGVVQEIYIYSPSYST